MTSTNSYARTTGLGSRRYTLSWVSIEDDLNITVRLKRYDLPRQKQSLNGSPFRMTQHGLGSSPTQAKPERSARIPTLSSARVPDEELPAQLALLSQRAPRFLFRAWSSSSGGHDQLNTEDAITPLAFFRCMGSYSIDDTTRHELESIIQYHLGYRINGLTKTIFSSWSQSLPFAICWAKGKHKTLST